MRIILIDDESITTKWLKKNIEDLNVNYHVERIFNNGKDALEYFERNNNIDVIFTDIKMPVMDGIEFLKQVRNLDPNVYVVILSAYDSFSFAREALRLKANQFILKPEITKDTLRELFSSIEKYLKTIKIDEPRSVTSLETQKFWLDIFYRKGDYDKALSIERFQNLNIHLHWNFIVLFNISIEMDSSKVWDVFELYAHEVGEYNHIISEGLGQYYVLFSGDNQEEIEVECRALISMIQNFIGDTFYIGKSRIETGYETIPDLFRQAEIAKQQLVFYKQFGMKEYQSLMSVTSENKYEIMMKNCVEKIGNYVPLCQQDNDCFYALQFYRELVKSKSFPERMVKSMVYEVLSEYKRGMDGDIVQMNDEKDIIKIFEAKTYQELEKLIETIEERFLSIRNNIFKNNNYSAPILHIIDFLQTNYKEAISLQDIAERVHMNRTYISTLFKKEVGQGINQFLLEIRIKEAKKRLLYTADSIQKIAIETGFEEQSYFSKIFKKSTGQSPIQYRKQKILQTSK